MTDTRYTFTDDSGDVRLSGFITPAPGGQASVLTEITTLLPAQIKALATTAVVVVPAAGLGTIIVPISAVGSLDFASVAYAGGTADIELLSSADPGSESSFGWTGTSFTGLEASTDVVGSALLIPLTATVPWGIVENRPLAVFNFGDQYTVGDSPYTITVCYYVAHLT